MGTLLGLVALAGVWIISAVLSLDASKATQITKDTALGYKDILKALEK